MRPTESEDEAMTEANAALPQVWVRPVNPEEYPGFAARRARPITRADLGDRFHTVGLRGFEFDRPPAPPPESFRIVRLKETLDLWTRSYDFGDIVWPMWPCFYAENWRELVDELAARELYLFDIWAYCPSGLLEKYEWSEYQASDELHAALLEKLGPRFLGYDNGEQDGRYIGNYAKQVCPAPMTRRQGYEAFKQYFDQLGNDLQNYLVALNSLTYPHAFASWDNHRMIGTESAQALPSVPMWYAFVRGAGKQYGLLWFGNASVWNRWGAKSLADPDAEDTDAPGFLTGPTAGTSLSLLKRMWYVLVMYGSVLMGFEAGHMRHTHPAIGTTEPGLPEEPTEIGQIQLDGTRWCAEHPDRGELHTPVALLWDVHAGWAPSRHLYTSDTYLVWGNMPYEKGDHQIDLLFRELYPHYEDAGFCHNERGFLTATPCGDSFDVLLTDVGADVLSRYPLVVVLGETRLEGEVLARLRAYVEAGGSVVAWADHLGDDAAGLFGVSVGEAATSNHAIIPGHPWTVNEPAYSYRRLEPTAGVEVLASTRQGAALAVRRRLPGGGSCTLFASEYGLSNPLPAADRIVNEVDQPLLSPYAMLEHVKAILLPALRAHNLLSVHGLPIQYLVNVTERTDRLVVTLCNNTPEPWSGAVRPTSAKVASGLNWMTGDALPAGDAVAVTVQPLDVVVVELFLDRPCFVARGAVAGAEIGADGSGGRTTGSSD
jgi:hypothetical protein